MSQSEPHDMTSYHVRRARDGEAASLEWVISRFSPLLRIQAEYRLTGPLRRLHDADDLVDEVWLVALERLGDLRPREGRWTPVLLKYLSSTLLNKINNLLTSHLRNPAPMSLEGGRSAGRSVAPIGRVAAGGTSVLGGALRHESQDAVHEALLRLEAKEREVLVLRGIEQIDNQEVARILGEQPGTVSKRFRRALGALRAQLPGSLFDELESYRRGSCGVEAGRKKNPESPSM